MWEELFIKNRNSEQLFVDHYLHHKDSPNIVYIQTPVMSVTDFKDCYKPFENHSFNVFALDCSGVGKSEGEISNFSVTQIENDIEDCIAYIKLHYSNEVFLFGGTGTGGVFAQHYASHHADVLAFAQYGVGIYKDFSHMGNFPVWTVKSLYPVLKFFRKLFPKCSLSLSLPKYNGKNAVKENEFYESIVKKNPNFFKMPLALLTSYLGIFIEKDSYLKESIQCPTLVFEALHDRYYPTAYYERYYSNLNAEKKLHVIDDVHISYIFHAEEICNEVALWFEKCLTKQS